MLRQIVLLVLLLPLALPAAAQENTNLVRIEVSLEETEIQTAISREALFEVTVRDVSLDDPSRIDPVPPVGYFYHYVTMTAEVIAGSPAGWLIAPPPTRAVRTGEVFTDVIGVRPTASIVDRQIQINLTVRADHQMPQFGYDEWHFVLKVSTPGFDSMTVVAGSLGEPLAPREVRDATVSVRNNGVFPRMFRMELVDVQDCGLTLVPSNDIAIPPRTTYDVPFTVRAPGDKVLYLSEDCPIRVTISDANDPGIIAATSVGSTVSGLYWKPEWTFAVLAVSVPLLLLFIFVRRRKQVIEEEILGKPQKPWTIPVERVYLEHLEAKDPRAAYVVRHYLMEEEYASSLLWYKHYKQATRGERAKETLVVRQEKRYERFQRQWEKRIAVPMREADRFEARLQRKLDRQAKRDVRKDRRAWKKTVAKLEAAVEAQNAKALARWEKAAAKAEKKNKPVPPRPELETPDLPPEPQLQKIQLADHKWNKKAQRFRRKMVKRQGNLEVKYERKDARMLHKLRRKVHKIARKLDDPQFVEEHPLLAGGASDAS